MAVNGPLFEPVGKPKISAVVKPQAATTNDNKVTLGGHHCRKPENSFDDNDCSVSRLKSSPRKACEYSLKSRHADKNTKIDAASSGTKKYLVISGFRAPVMDSTANKQHKAAPNIAAHTKKRRVFLRSLSTVDAL